MIFHDSEIRNVVGNYLAVTAWIFYFTDVYKKCGMLYNIYVLLFDLFFRGR